MKSGWKTFGIIVFLIMFLITACGIFVFIDIDNNDVRKIQINIANIGSKITSKLSDLLDSASESLISRSNKILSEKNTSTAKKDSLYEQTQSSTKVSSNEKASETPTTELTRTSKPTATPTEEPTPTFVPTATPTKKLTATPTASPTPIPTPVAIYTPIPATTLETTTIPENSSLLKSDADSSGADDSSIENAIEKNDIKLYIHAQSEVYFFSDRYTVELWLDDNMLGEIPNGEELATLVQTKSGVHSVAVYKKGDHKVFCSKEISLTKDLSLSFKIEHENAIRLLEYTESDLPDIEMPDIYGLTITEANNTLKNSGFRNITTVYAKEEKLKSADNWIVTGLNCEPGHMYKSMELVEVNCSIKEIPMIDTIGLTYSEAADKLHTLGFENVVQNQEIDIDGIKNNEWIVTRQNYEANTLLCANEEVVLDCSIDTITTASSAEFNDLLFSSGDSHLDSRVFVKNNDGRILEFYAIVLEVEPYRNYTTRYNIFLLNHDSILNTVFLFENVNFGDMNVNGTDSVKTGKRFHVYARIDGYDTANVAIKLKPLKLQYITDTSLNNKPSASVNSKSKMTENNEWQTEEQSKNEHVIDYAYVGRFNLYSIYYAFDIDTGTALFLSDDEKSVQQMKYQGDLQNGITVFWTSGPDSWIETLKATNDKKHAYLQIANDSYISEMDECTPSEVESLIASYGFDIAELVQPKEMTVVITTACNIREQPSYEAKTIKWTNIGETYTLIDDIEGWYEIEMESNKTGYVPADKAGVD